MVIGVIFLTWLFGVGVVFVFGWRIGFWWDFECLFLFLGFVWIFFRWVVFLKLIFYFARSLWMLWFFISRWVCCCCWGVGVVSKIVSYLEGSFWCLFFIFFIEIVRKFIRVFVFYRVYFRVAGIFDIGVYSYGVESF